MEKCDFSRGPQAARRATAAAWVGRRDRGLPVPRGAGQQEEKAHRRHRDEILTRTIAFSSFDARVFLNATSDRGIPPRIESSSYLTLKGKLDKPIRDTTAVELNVHKDDRTEPGPARPASVGAIIQTRPHVGIIVGIATGEFDRLWQLAASGHLKHGHITFTKPRYNSSKVVSIGWSNAPIE